MRRRYRCSRIELALASLVLLLVASAQAEPNVSLDQRIAAAMKLYAAQDYAGAVRELESAYRIKPLNRLLFNLGIAHRKLGHLREALDYFERYRSARSTLDAQVPVDRYIDDLRTKLAAEERVAPPETPTVAAPRPTVEAPQATPPPIELRPAPVAAAPVRPLLVVSRPVPPPRRKLYKAWWVWTAAAAATVAAVAIGVGATYTQPVETSFQVRAK